MPPAPSPRFGERTVDQDRRRSNTVSSGITGAGPAGSRAAQPQPPSSAIIAPGRSPATSPDGIRGYRIAAPACGGCAGTARNNRAGRKKKTARHLIPVAHAGPARGLLRLGLLRLLPSCAVPPALLPADLLALVRRPALPPPPMRRPPLGLLPTTHAAIALEQMLGEEPPLAAFQQALATARPARSLARSPPLSSLTRAKTSGCWPRARGRCCSHLGQVPGGS
jgi:hypothetical protein